MRELKDIDSVDEVKIILRTFKLMKLENKLNLKFKTPSFVKFFHLWKFYKRRNLIYKICELGGVITGSRVLSNSYINGIRILDRDTNDSDWDILVTEENLYKITSVIKFQEGENKLTHRVVDEDDYGYGACDIDLIVIKKMPEYHREDKLLLADPLYIIEEKMKSNDDKNANDLKEIFWKFRDLSNIG